MAALRSRWKVGEYNRRPSLTLEVEPSISATGNEPRRVRYVHVPPDDVEEILTQAVKILAEFRAAASRLGWRGSISRDKRGTHKRCKPAAPEL